MAYIGKSPSTGVRNRFIYTATAGQTTFSGTDDHNRTLSYTDAEFTDVFLNGVKLDKSDYTATSGTSIVLDSGATVGDTLEVLGFDTFSVFSGEFSQDVTIGGAATLTGDLTVDTTTLHVDSTNNRVGIGTSSPDASLHIEGSGVSALRFGNIGPSSNSAIRLSRDDITVTSGNPLGYLQFGGNDSTSNTDAAFAYVSGEASGTHGAGDNPTDLTFGTTADGSSTPAERMRIDSSGNVGIGTSSPAQLLSVEQSSTGTVDTLVKNTGTGASANARVMSFVSGASGGDPSIGLGITGVQDYFWRIDNSDSDKLKLDSNGTTRMTIDSSGNVLVATTDTPSTSVFGYRLAATGLFKNSRNTGASGASMQVFGNAGEARIMGDGDLLNTNNSYGQLSDETLKQDIVDAASQWADIKALKVRKFRFKDNPTGTLQIGVIAQELEASGMNGLVKQIDLNQDEDSEETIKAVKYSVLHMKAVKALQEAMERIEALETKVATLETQNADFETRLTALEAE